MFGKYCKETMFSHLPEVLSNRGVFIVDDLLRLIFVRFSITLQCSEAQWLCPYLLRNLCALETTDWPKVN